MFGLFVCKCFKFKNLDGDRLLVQQVRQCVLFCLPKSVRLWHDVRK